MSNKEIYELLEMDVIQFEGMDVITDSLPIVDDTNNN
jgi:hypothetical protein